MNPVALLAVKLTNGSGIFGYYNPIVGVRLDIEQLLVHRNLVANLILVGYESKQQPARFRRLDFLSSAIS